MGSIRSLVLMQLMVLLNVILTVKASTPAVAKPGCRRRCGDVIIPYPFGTGGDCNITAGFFINCNTSFIPHKPFLRNGNIEVINVSTDGQLRILSNTSYDCYNTSYRNWFFYSFRLSKFLINNNKNKFTAIGCDTYAVVKQAGSYGQRYATGCLSFCNNITDVSNGSCSGIGCCQTSIPKDVRSYNISLRSYANHTNVLPENHCSYAFVAEVDSYTFSASDLRGFEFQSRQFPITLDWNIGNTSCNEANMDVNNFACKEYSKCVDSENNSGYLCKCLEGYEGNPYLPNGCQDINECESMSPCNGTARCTNLPGTYNCSCPVGYEGDGKKSGTGCSLPNKDQSKTSPLIVALGVAIGFLGLLLGIVLWCWMLRQRQISKLREANFQQNAGILLREQLSKRQGYREDVKVFTAEELEKATNNYNESRILGQGGLGTVYKGILADNQIVAIKKSIIGDPSQVEQFINEIMVLYKINHRNVVKLLGCWLETQVPLLVYEYITTRTLFHHLHNDDATFYLSWETRLRIATETAEALSYLHSAASIPIIHRDIKLANILLDDNYTTKVFDFGASRLIPSDQAQITTIVQGTFGYLDPEYMLSSLLTEKSDVYSFGVVLMELLTGQKVVCFKRPEENQVLPMYFTSLMKEDRLLDILDPQVLNDENVEQFMEVATLARRCVRVKGEERPTMKEVSHELAGLQAMAKHPWSKSNLVSEESEYLLGKFPSTYDDGVTSSSIGMGYDSINNKITFELEDAR